MTLNDSRKPGPSHPDGFIHDLLIVGGGINGTGIARDAAGRGLAVVLVEQGDLARATSSASTKLIHGGLRYLEYYEFRLVREALQEREVLLSMAPHLIRPMQFILPHVPDMRPAWLVRSGLFLYDHLGGRKRLPGSRRIDLHRQTVLGAPLDKRYRTAFTYADCWVDDARLVVLNAKDAAERGADIWPRHRCLRAWRANGIWQADIAAPDGTVRSVQARMLINAAGPWAGQFARDQAATALAGNVRLVKGSHIVVPGLRPADKNYAYILQNDDRRIVFAIPYEDRFTLIGTTDMPYSGDPAKVTISTEETEYLCRAVNRYFAQAIGPQDVVWSYAGVRPLYDDGADDASAVTRDYVLELATDADGKAPILSVLGGKLTTYRRLAEAALAKLAPYMPLQAPAWTVKVPLPGGDMKGADFDLFLTDMRARYPALPETLVTRWARAYGTRMERLMDGRRGLNDLGQDFGQGLTAAEIDYLCHEEWAHDADDILWRRSKLGLHMTASQRASVQDYLSGRGGSLRSTA